MLNILLCDDCKETLNEVKIIVTQFCKEMQIEDVNIVTFDHSQKIINYVKTKRNEKNIYILDIELNNDINGVMIGKEIRKIDNYKGEMIFLTYHNEMSFKVFQYKLKALEFIDKSYIRDHKLKESLLAAIEILNNDKEKIKKLPVKIGTQVFNIPFQEIIYIETIKKSRKVVLHAKSNRLEFYNTLKELMGLLDDNFIKVHKTTIVNKAYIKNICKDSTFSYIELNNGITCPLSRTGIKEVKKHWI